MSGIRTVAQKMGVRAGSRAFLSLPTQFDASVLDLPPLDVAPRLQGHVDYLHLFVVSQAELREKFGAFASHLADGGRLWVSWPKAGRRGSDLTIKSVIAIGYDGGLVESTCLRVDDEWAALKFTHPKAGKVYQNSYGTLPVRDAS